MRIGRYEIRRRLGAGAFGTVYLAYDPQLTREVALKVPNPGVLDNPTRVERFLREAKAAAGLQHPHIIPVFDAGRDDEQYFIASAFVKGEPLAEAMEEDGIDMRLAAGYVRQLAEALAYAHSQGVIHRDVKPANILKDDKGQLHLLDFGLASRQEEKSRLTNDGSVMGTPSYMSPEQAAGQKGEARPQTDQYAAGVVLYELLTGRVPFEGPLSVVIHNVINTPPDPPSKFRKGLPKDLETICLKAMEKEPAGRYADCGELGDDLRRWMEGEPILARRLSLSQRAIRWTLREPRLAAALGAVLLSLVAIGLLLSVRNVRLVRELETVTVEKEVLREKVVQTEKRPDTPAPVPVPPAGNKEKEEKLIADRISAAEKAALAKGAETFRKNAAEVAKAKTLAARWQPLAVNKDDLVEGKTLNIWDRPSEATLSGRDLTLKGGLSYRGDLIAGDCVIRARVVRVSGGNASLRYGPFLYWFNGSEGDRIGRIGIGRDDGAYRDIVGPTPVTLSAENTCQMAIAVQGKTIRLYANRRPILEVVQDWPGGGRPGVQVITKGHGIFRNLEVFDLEGTELTPAEVLSR